MLLSKRYVDKVLNDEDIEIVEGQGCSSVHVDEVVDAFLLATLNNKAYGHVFNVSNPATYITHRELYRFIIQLTRSKSRIKVIPNQMPISCMPESIEKIQRILGWKPQKNKKHLKQAIVCSVESLIRRTS
jgi:nucleoside-diphosphate-sugar epimerase